MKCPECGQWNRASMPHCIQCGAPLNIDEASRLQWKDKLKDGGPSTAYLRADEFGQVDATPDARDSLAGEMQELKKRKREGAERQSQLSRNSVSRADSDVVVMSGGSSQGKKDMSADLIGRAADCGVLTHGIAAKPGKPTITGYDKASRTLFIGLPGHPAAALMVYEQILIHVWRDFTGSGEDLTIRARVNTNIPAAPGRMTFQLVQLRADGSEAVPVFARSGMISPMSLSDGYFVMSENTEGIRPGDTVTVHLWR